MAEMTEADAESALFAAVMGPDVDNLSGAPSRQVASPEDADIDETADDERIEAEEPEQKPEAKATPEKQAAPEDDYIEIEADEEGGEPKRLLVKDVLAGFQAHEKIKGQETKILEQVETQAMQQARGQLERVDRFSKQAAATIQATLQLLREPQPPNEDMLDPNSASYNPDGYHRGFAQWQRAMGQFNQAKGLGEQLLRQANDAQAQIKDAREAREEARLRRVWPEFYEGDTLDKFVSDMGKAYGYAPEELDESLTDHRNALVARDALAYRALMASGKDVKAAVQARAPKLVRSKQEAKGGGAQARDAGGRYASDALANLRKTNSDDAAVAYFAGLARQGRI